MATKTVKLIRPKSVSDSNYTEYEYLLAWIGSKGNLYQYMFTDREIDYSVDAEPVNTRNSKQMSSLIASEETGIILTAEDISRNDFLVLLTIFKSPVCWRVYQDATTERVTVVSNSKTYMNANQRFNLEFEILKPQGALYE